MAGTPSGQQGYPGQQTPFDDTSTPSQQRFMVEQMLARVNTAMLVQVKKVTNKGEVKEVGTVDVLPLAKMMDGEGNTFSHGIINSLPYFRLQGGAKKAVILDPKEGDIGVAVFGDRDLSGVIKNKKESPPGSFRRHDMADGMFFPCFLGGKPETFVRFTDDDHIFVAVDEGNTYVEVQKNWIRLQVPGRSVHVRPSRVDLGKLDAPHAVITSGGPSLRVFAVVDEGD